MINMVLIFLLLCFLWYLLGFKKPLGYQKYNPPGDLRKDCLVLFVNDDRGKGISIFLPWMIHGPYQNLWSNKTEYGWRCLRLNIAFLVKWQGRIVAPFRIIPFWEAV